MAVGTTKVVQVTNIAPQATKDQMHILFSYLGKIEDIRLYPTIRDVSCPVQSRICYIKFVDTGTVGIAQHMTNTVFIDRALIVIPVQNGEIPDEYYALEMTRNGSIVPGLNLNEPKLPAHVINSVQGTGSDQVIVTADPQLETLSLPLYPPLPATYDSVKIEETRRTIVVTNLDSSITPEDLIEFFSAAGEVKFLRSATRSSNPDSKLTLIEFSDQPSVINALKLTATEFKGSVIEVQHATMPIIKPQAKSNEAAQKEIEEAMSRFKEAQNMINASIEPVIGMLTKDKRRRSRSRSRGRRRRSRSRSRSRRSRSRRRRSNSRGARRSRSRERRKSRSRRRSPSRTRRVSKSRSSTKAKPRSRERRRSKERDHKSKEKTRVEVDVEKKRSSRSRSRSKRSRSRDRVKVTKRRSRSRGRRRTPSPAPRVSKKRSRSKSRERKKERKDKPRDKRERERERSRSRSKVRRNYDEEEKGFDTDRDRLRDVDGNLEKDSSEKSDNMDISNSP